MKNKLAFTASIIFFSLLGARSAFAATFNTIPATNTVKVGDTLIIDLKIDTESKDVNASQATIQFPKGIISAKSVDKTGSVFNFWLDEPSIDNRSGLITFTAGSTNGFSGRSLEVLRVIFTVIGKGEGDITLSGSAIANADGSGANILSKANGAHIISATEGEITPAAGAVPSAIPTPIPAPVQITRPAVTAKNTSGVPVLDVALYPDPTRWYNQSGNFLVKWELPADITDVATAVTHDPTSAPVKSEGLFDDKTFAAVDNGVQYLHVRFKNNIGWGKTAHYRIAVDTQPPLGFTVKVKGDGGSDVPNPIITYETGDQLSGIDHYDIRIDNQPSIVVNTGSYQLPLLPPGDHAVAVTAWDKAENSTSASVSIKILPIQAPVIGATNTNVFVGEGNLFISGTVVPGFSVLISLKDSKGAVIQTLSPTPDAVGHWTIDDDNPLKAGTYSLDVLAKDSRGALSFPVTLSVKVKNRPIVTLFGLGITEGWFFSVIIVALGLAFAFGKISEKRRAEQRGRHTFVLERDAHNILKFITKDADAIRRHPGLADLDDKQQTEIGNSLARIDDNVKKMDQYVIGDIENLNK